MKNASSAWIASSSGPLVMIFMCLPSFSHDLRYPRVIIRGDPMKAAVFAVLMLMPGAAWAGCANYVDGSMTSPAPKVTTCFEGKCEDTSVDYACGNIHNSFVGFANGWRVDFIVEGDGEDPDPKVSTVTTRGGKTFPNDALTCKVDGKIIDCFGASGD